MDSPSNRWRRSSASSLFPSAGITSKIFYSFPIALLALSLPLNAAIELTEATFTQVVNQVVVTDPMGNSPRSALLNSRFANPDIVATGANSRAELTAPDSTVTRVGSNTQFSFMAHGRGINLDHGTILFNSPHGKGGGLIQTAAATAGVLGTTIIVSSTENGGFKLLVIEGTAKVTLTNDRSFILHSGQLTYIIPGATKVPPIFEYHLSKQISGSRLIEGFNAPLPSETKILTAESMQDRQIAQGKAVDTGILLGPVVNNQVQLVDTNVQQTYVLTQATGSPTGSGSLSGLTSTGTGTFTGTGTGTTTVTGQTFSNSSGTLVINSPGSFSSMNSSYTGYSDNSGSNNGVTFNSPQDISLNGDTITLLGPANGPGLSVFAGNNISLTNINFNYPSATVMLTGPGGMTAGSITLAGGSFNNSFFTAASNGNFSLNGTIITGNSGVNITSQNGSIDLTNGTITGGSGVNVNAGNSSNTSNAILTVNNTNFNGNMVNLVGGFGPGGALNMINGGNFAGPNVAMQAYTLNLANVNFAAGSQVNLGSFNGTANFGSSVTGYVNFVNNDKFGGTVINAANLTSTFSGNIHLNVIP